MSVSLFTASLSFFYDRILLILVEIAAADWRAATLARLVNNVATAGSYTDGSIFLPISYCYAT